MRGASDLHAPPSGRGYPVVVRLARASRRRSCGWAERTAELPLGSVGVINFLVMLESKASAVFDKLNLHLIVFDKLNLHLMMLSYEG